MRMATDTPTRTFSSPSDIESVQVDGGAFNVREGNHALNLAAIYGLRSHLAPFFTLTGDYARPDGHGGHEPFARFVGR